MTENMGAAPDPDAIDRARKAWEEACICCISAKDWDSIWLSHSAWCKDIWLLQTNSDCISSGPRLDIADLTLAEALDTFSRNRDVLEYRPFSWNPERDGLAGEDLEARNDMRNEEHER